ncbi:MAG: CDP-alcohol phosphatidyltransferase family protein [Patescibacteria group bacterium]|nr:CDP-alcohol phosphatidyltransferase family protein [Patescibacteria group bacterium]
MESIKELRKICQEKGYKEHITIRFYRIFSIYVTKACLILKLKPHFITALSFLAGIIGGYFYLKTQFLLGSFLFFLFYVLDNVDGEVARYLKTSSNFGAWLDIITGHLLYPYLFITLGLGIYLQTKMFQFVILGIMASTSKLVERSVFQPQIKTETKDSLDQKQNSIKLWASFIGKFPVICTILLIYSLLGWEIYFLYFYAIYLTLFSLGKVVLTGWRIYSSEN